MLVAKNYDKRVADGVFNGCGAGGWKGKLVPETVWGVSIREACRIHDYDYWIGGLGIEAKKVADIRFYQNMLLIFEEVEGWSRRLNWLRERRARFYLSVLTESNEALKAFSFWSRE